jgi:hypothetical protein
VQDPAPVRRHLGRRIVAIVLVVLTALLAPLAISAVWIHERILTTDGWVDTVAPLAEDPAVIDAVSQRIVNTIFERADVQDRITDILPGPVDALGRTFTNSLRNLATSQTQRFLESEAFQSLWEEANRVAHEQVVAMFSGQGDALENHDGQVVLDLGAVADKVRQRLVDHGVGVLRRVSIPKGQAGIVLFQSDAVTQFQTVFRLLDQLWIALPIAFLVVAAAAIAVSVRRRRTVVELGLAVAAGLLLLLAGLHYARREYLSAATNAQLNGEAAESVFDTITSKLETWTWMLLVVALVAAVAAFLSDPGKLEWVARKLHGDRAANRSGVAPWMRQHRLALSVGGAAAALVVLAIWPSPTLLVVVVVLVLLAFYLGMVTAIARLTTPDNADV